MTTLFDLRDRAVELTVHFAGTRIHGTVSGRVRYVAASPACWVGDFCFPPETEVEPDDAGEGCYSVYVRNREGALCV